MRSEAIMAINNIQNTFSAANLFGKGIANVAGRCRAIASCAASFFEEAIASCGLYLIRGCWCALSLKRMPAAVTAKSTPATCWSITDRRHQRHQRWMSGVVVVDPGTVGVC
jgi:hypothetical protein